MVSTAVPDHFRIPGTFNYRDVGGLRTTAGATVRGGVLLRSAQLCRLDERGHETLRDLGVSTVHDLRGPYEAERMGADLLPDGIRLEVTPFHARIGAPHEKSAGPDQPTAREEENLAPHEARHLNLLDVYTEFPSMPLAGAAITALARSLVRGDGAVLVHCAAGKDRTGWAVATLLRAVGVTEEDILADYLLSNHAMAALADDMARNGSDATATLPASLLGVSVEYLDAATEAMHRNYGDLDGYFEAIGLTAELRAGLHTRLVG
ncbi:MAG: tyrosine-protein phosphatase [Nocardia sp.]|nr:tyrosine-protein phosphatase [Nocardia sp.]